MRRFSLHMAKEDPQANEMSPLDVESLSDLQAAQLVTELHEMFVAFAIQPARDWGLSIRAQNVLKRNNLQTLWDLQQIQKRDILNLKGCGLKSTLEVYTVGKANGVDLVQWICAVQQKYESTFAPLIKRLKKKAP